jgi:hypothetical protein
VTAANAMRIPMCGAIGCRNVALPQRPVCAVHNAPSPPAPCDGCAKLAAENQRLRDAYARFADDLLAFITERNRRVKATY